MVRRFGPGLRGRLQVHSDERPPIGEVAVEPWGDVASEIAAGFSARVLSLPSHHARHRQLVRVVVSVRRSAFAAIITNVDRHSACL